MNNIFFLLSVILSVPKFKFRKIIVENATIINRLRLQTLEAQHIKTKKKKKKWNQ